MLAVSANSNTSFEDLAQSAKGHLWVQMYPFRDKEMTKDWLKRAKDNGYEAVVVTLDSQWPPKRERNIRNNYRRSRGVNYSEAGGAETPRPAGRGGEGSDPAATWTDLEWIKAASRPSGGRQGHHDRRGRRALRRSRRRRRDRFQSWRQASR